MAGFYLLKIMMPVGANSQVGVQLLDIRVSRLSTKSTDGASLLAALLDIDILQVELNVERCTLI